MCSVMMRVVTSTAPPAPDAQITVMVRSGYAACAEEKAAQSAATAITAYDRMRAGWAIVVLLLFVRALYPNGARSQHRPCGLQVLRRVDAERDAVDDRDVDT